MADDYREEEFIVPIRCPNCGGLNPPENKVCQLCGTRLTGATPAPLPAVQPIVPSSNDSFDEPTSAAMPPASPFSAAPPASPFSQPSQPSQPQPPVAPPPSSPPPTANQRGGSGLASRLGGGATGSTAPSPANWLGDLRRTMGGDNPVVDDRPLPPNTPPASPFAAPPPATPPPARASEEDERGYMVPPSPTTSPYRREDLHTSANEPTDWLSSLRSSANFTAPVEAEPEEEESDVPAVDVPDWLRNLRTEGGAATDAPAQAQESARPSWLGGPNETDTGPIDRAINYDEDEEVEPISELPPWLQGGTDMLNPNRLNAPETQSGARRSDGQDIPSWMQVPPEAPASNEPAAPDFNNWFTSRPSTPAAPAETPATSQPSSDRGFLSDSDGPSWLRELSVAPPPAAPTPMQSAASPATPEEDVLDADEYQPQTAQKDGDQEATAAPPAWMQANEDVLDERQEFQPELSEPAAEAELATNNRQSAEITAPATTDRRTTTGGLISRDADLPPWLRVVSGTDGMADAEAETTADTPASPSLRDTGSTDANRFFPTSDDTTVPDWLRSIGREPEDITPTAAEALTAPVAEPVQRIQRVMTVRPPRPGAAEVLASLASAPSANTRTSPLDSSKEQRSYVAGISRWLLGERGIYLLTALIMVLVVVGDVYFKTQPLGNISPAPSANVDAFYQTINALPPNSPVLVAYDWDASRQAEMEPLARAVTCHLGAMSARFATVSFVPTGPAYAQQVAHATVDRSDQLCATRAYAYGRDYVNLGYTAGGEFALRSMVGNIGSVFSNDYVNNAALFEGSSLAAMKGISKLSDYKLIIILEGEEGYARSWIEQVATQPGTPLLLLGSPASLYPSLQPYINTTVPTRFAGAVAGLSNAAYYEKILTSKKALSQTNISFSLNALNFAYVFVALMIVIGNIVFLTRLVNSRK